MTGSNRKLAGTGSMLDNHYGDQVKNGQDMVTLHPLTTHPPLTHMQTVAAINSNSKR